MRSVRQTTNRLFFVLGFSCLTLSVVKTEAQENSPYSRYGLGDLVPAQNILNRGMGGLTSAFSDYQAVNFSNPASYTGLKITTLDVGLDYTSRTLKTLNPPKKFNSAYLIPSYVQIGLPLSKKKNWGMNIGLRPISRVNYDIINEKRVAGVDSIRYNYFGNGGTYQAFTGMAYGTKNLSVGFNAGYMFGTKEYSTKVSFINDTVAYKSTNSADTAQFGGLFLNAGIQYRIKLNKKTYMRLGLNGNLKSTLNATKNSIRETVQYNSNVGLQQIDSVYKGVEQKGTILYPSSWATGIMIESEDSWMIGAEFNVANWADYRYFGEADKMKNTWTARLGGQFMPNNKSTKFWDRVMYRFGASFGTEPVQINKSIPNYSFTFGTGLPVRRNVYTNQYTTINTAFELGFRGNKSNDIRENIFRLSLGFNLSDIWFNKPKYQ